MKIIKFINEIEKPQFVIAVIFSAAIILLGVFSLIAILNPAPQEEAPELSEQPLAADTNSRINSSHIETYKDNTVMSDFYEKEIDDEIFNRIEGKSYKDNCTVPLSDLSYLHLLYIDFDGKTQEGEMICNRAIASDLLDIFEKLYQAKYPIERIELVDEYDADDEQSMSHNNSSCFNFRFISYTTTVSKHGLGMAVDINPLYNPYVKMVGERLSIEPENASDYVDRTLDFPHKIDENDLCYQLFIEHGFTWGGNWTHSKDYQHFEKDL